MASRVSQFRSVEAAAFDHRSAVRHAVQVKRATARGQGKAPVAATLCDISIYGCRIASAVDHAADERVWLRLNGSPPIAATVVWHDGGFTGCRFDEPIARDLVRALTILELCGAIPPPSPAPSIIAARRAAAPADRPRRG